MDSLKLDGEDLWQGLARHGILEADFGIDGCLQTDCAYCGKAGAMTLRKSTYRAVCGHCKVDARLSSVVDQLDYKGLETDDDRGSGHVEDVDGAGGPVHPERSPAEVRVAVAEQRKLSKARLEAERAAALARETAIAARKAKRVERFIMTLLALIFLGAGLAAAGLSGFANYQAFRAGVSDPVQSQIWGWSGVIASVCSFGGFTFFWWHATAKRFKEAVRALVFALAGAGTSIAGTALYMDNNESAYQSERAEQVRAQTILQDQIDDWTRQLEGIPPQTRSVEGLEQYLAGVEAAGRTHQKPYRDAQNELGLAKRRDSLEANISQARQVLLSNGGAAAIAAERKSIPAWFFAAMLEVFSSQGTSIAFVSLLLLYGRKPADGAAAPGPVAA